MDLEMIIPSEVNQTKRNIKQKYAILYTWNLKRNDTYELIYKTETDPQTQRINLWLPAGKGWGKGYQGVQDQYVHNGIFKINN